MAWPTQSAALALNQIDGQMLSIRQRLVQAIVRMAAGSVTSEYVLNIYADLKRTNEVLDDLKETPGIVEHARQVKGDLLINPAAEFAAAQTAIDSAIAWIEANFPKEAGGFLKHVQFSGGAVTFNNFSSAATAGFRTELQAIVDLIEE